MDSKGIEINTQLIFNITNRQDKNLALNWFELNGFCCQIIYGTPEFLVFFNQRNICSTKLLQITCRINWYSILGFIPLFKHFNFIKMTNYLCLHFKTNLFHIWNKFETNVKQIWNKCETNLKRNWNWNKRHGKY
jgi:hypothetical protein